MAFGCSRFAAQYIESPGSRQPLGAHTLRAKEVGLTDVAGIDQEVASTTAWQMLLSLISHEKNVYPANCSDAGTWRLIAPSINDWPPGAWFTVKPSGYSVPWRKVTLSHAITPSRSPQDNPWVGRHCGATCSIEYGAPQRFEKDWSSHHHDAPSSEPQLGHLRQRDVSVIVSACHLLSELDGVFKVSVSRTAP